MVTVGSVVEWSSKTRRYRGRVVRLANHRAAQVRSDAGLIWLVPLVELRTLKGARS